MSEFTKVELLDGNDTMYCSACKEHQPTKKQLSVFGTPEVFYH
jgi:ubiquitin C-terminal hydrolase